MLRLGLAFFFVALERVGRRPLLCARDPQFFCAPSLYSLPKGFCETVLFS